MKPTAKAEEGCHPLIDASHLFPRQLAEHAPDPPFVNGPQLVGQREGPLGEAALARCEWRIKKPLAWSPCHRHHAHQRKALVADDVRIAPRRGRASLASLHPALAGNPPNRLASAAVDQGLGIFLGQAARPFLESLLGEFGAFGMGVPQ